MLLVECNVLEKVKVINEGTKGGPTRLRLQGKFQQCDEQNNNGRIYPKPILEAQVQSIQEKIGDRSLVGALDHPNNDAIHLSQASHLITKLWLEKDGSVMGECEILSTPNGKIVEALINDGVKIGISSRGVGSVTEGIKGKIVNEDFKLITFDLVSDPSTRGAFPELTESIRENSQRAQEIVSKHKKDRVLLTMLESKISEAVKNKNLSKKQKAMAAKTPPFDKIDKGDLNALRNDEGEAQGTDSNVDDLPDDYEYKVPHGMGTKRNRRKDSSTNIGEAVIEGFKRVCWGDRYDEMGGGIEAIRRSAAARKNPSAPTKAETERARVTPRTPGERAVPTEAQKKADYQDEFQAAIQRAADARAAERKRPANQKSVGDSTTIDRFADVIRERCWKGYKPVKGKKPYSKGSCTKEGYEQLGDVVINEIRGRRAFQRVGQAQRAANDGGLQRPFGDKVSAKDFAGAEKYARRKFRGGKRDAWSDEVTRRADAEHRAKSR
jgi:hypothetical protein